MVMESQYLNQKAYTINDETLYSCLSESILQACRMIAPTTDEKSVRIIWDTIRPMIRKFYNDFTANQLSSAIISGAYGLYGSFSKVNGQIINDWFRKKRDDISKEEEENERREAQNKREKHVLTCSNGGYAVLLFLFYHENQMEEIPFATRLKLVEENGICPNTGVPVREVINSYLKQR